MCSVCRYLLEKEMKSTRVIRRILGYSIVGLSAICCMVFVILKLTAVVAMSWSVVFFPLLIPVILCVVIAILMFACIFIWLVVGILCGILS